LKPTSEKPEQAHRPGMAVWFSISSKASILMKSWFYCFNGFGWFLKIYQREK